MKKRTNKGMALASTVIMMTIVMMMSALMMTLSLYCSQVTSLNAQKVEDRKVLDEIGNIFLKNKDNPDAALIYVKEHNSGMKYVDGENNEVTELTSGPSGKSIKGSMGGMKMKITVKETSSKWTLTVTGTTRGNKLMKIECVKSTDARTGEVTTALKSWAYAG